MVVHVHRFSLDDRGFGLRLGLADAERPHGLVGNVAVVGLPMGLDVPNDWMGGRIDN